MSSATRAGPSFYPFRATTPRLVLHEPRRSLTAHPVHAPVPLGQGRTSRGVAVFSHGRLLRAVLRRRTQGGTAARHHADATRAVRRRTDSDGRRTVSRSGKLSRAAGTPRRIGG